MDEERDDIDVRLIDYWLDVEEKVKGSIYLRENGVEEPDFDKVRDEVWLGGSDF